MPDLPPGLRIRKSDIEQLKKLATRCAPEETCGILGGKDGIVQIVIPATNMLHSLVRFQIDPAEQLTIFEHLERKGIEMAAVYHSHPYGPEGPSQVDITNHFYPESAVVILSNSCGWIINAYLITDGSVKKIPIEIV